MEANVPHPSPPLGSRHCRSRHCRRSKGAAGAGISQNPVDGWCRRSDSDCFLFQVSPAREMSVTSEQRQEASTKSTRLQQLDVVDCCRPSWIFGAYSCMEANVPHPSPPLGSRHCRSRHCRRSKGAAGAGISQNPVDGWCRRSDSDCFLFQVSPAREMSVTSEQRQEASTKSTRLQQLDVVDCCRPSWIFGAYSCMEANVPHPSPPLGSRHCRSRHCRRSKGAAGAGISQNPVDGWCRRSVCDCLLFQVSPAREMSATSEQRQEARSNPTRLQVDVVKLTRVVLSAAWKPMSHCPTSSSPPLGSCRCRRSKGAAGAGIPADFGAQLVPLL